MSTTIIYHDSREGPSTDIENGGLAHLILTILGLENLPIMALTGCIPERRWRIKPS